MCLALVAIDAHPVYGLVIAANRDEYHARSTEQAHWWRNGILAGRDGVAGGTWLGVDRRGRWALVTNFREAGRNDPAAPSRGTLVVDALVASRAPLAQAAHAVAHAGAMNGFNLLVGTHAAAAYGSNRASGGLRLASSAARSAPVPPGTATGAIHAVSNHLLDTPWSKLLRAKRALAAWTVAPGADLHALFEVLSDREPARDDELPRTGLALELERALSSPFIAGERYGTRSSTVVAFSRTGWARFIERSYGPGGAAGVDATFEFELEPSVLA